MEEKMSDLRFFVEKKKCFDLDAKRLEKQFREELGININDLRLINCYDIFNLNDNKEDIEKIKKMILSEPVTDTITTELDLKGKKYFAVEFLPGQFDQRADSALQCIDIVSSTKQNADVLTSKIIILNDELSRETEEAIYGKLPEDETLNFVQYVRRWQKVKDGKMFV